MFEELKKFKKIIVTGPQRSGTRICAKMLAYEFDLQYISETETNHGTRANVIKLCEQGDNFVAQCPGFSANVTALKDMDDVAIVFMMRDTKDIIKSQQRIGWSSMRNEFKKYGVGAKDIPGHPEYKIAPFKYEKWKEQKEELPNAFEITYQSLSAHDLWYDPKDRRGWGIDQTAPKGVIHAKAKPVETEPEPAPVEEPVEEEVEDVDTNEGRKDD